MNLSRLSTTVFSCLAWFVSGHGSPPLSRHYRLLEGGGEQGPKVVVVADGGETTGGPFAFSSDIYTPGGDLLATANGRSAVLDGIPLTIEFVLYAVNATTQDTTPLENAEVYLWQTDAAGVYSYVQSMGTENETWLRARATSDANGTAVFKTILPGWYPGRCIHFHVRVRLYEQENYYVTSQLFVADEFLQSYNKYGLYAQNLGRQTQNENDGIFRRLGPMGSDLILTFHGDNESGYRATFHLGIDAGDVGVSLNAISPNTGNDASNVDNEDERQENKDDAGKSESGTSALPFAGKPWSLDIFCFLLSSAVILVL